MTDLNLLTRVAADVLFRRGADVDAFFVAQTGHNFIDWFNLRLAGNELWANHRLGDTRDVRARFTAIWDQNPTIFGTPAISLVQFSALMCILINEVGQDLLPVSEGCGRPGYPGLAYPFSTIRGVKQAYNSAPLNRLAGDLFFDDAAFWEAHHTKPLAVAVRSHPELRPAWNLTNYPTPAFPTSLDPTITGFVQEADFFKFRGRGFIQATWRANYKEIIAWVQQYTGNQPTVLQYATRWNKQDADTIATQSSNQDWDMLFQETGLVIACAAIGLHNRASGNYLMLAHDAETLALGEDRPGTLFRMGYRISGGVAYAQLFQNRVMEMLSTLNYQAAAAGWPPQLRVA